MTFDATIQDFLQAVSLVVTPALGVAAYYLKRLGDNVKEGTRRIAGVEDQLRRLNGRLLQLETWRDIHQRLCEERHQQTHADIVEVRREHGTHG